jgi:8-oxoguanine deaminase
VWAAVSDRIGQPPRAPCCTTIGQGSRQTQRLTVPVSSTWIRSPRASFGLDPQRSAGGIVIRGSRIVEHVPGDGAPSGAVDEIVDASRLVLLPGLINTHHHFYQTLTRAFGPALNQPLFPWLEALYPVWAGLTEDMVAVATELALCELLLSGCTTAVDHHYVFGDRLGGAIDRQFAVAEELGMRVVLTRGSMSLGASSGGLPPDVIVQPDDAILADCERLIAAHHDPRPGAMCQLALAPCSPFSVSANLMRDTAALAVEHDLRLHTHLAETLDENAFCMDRFGARPLDYLESVGWLNSRTWIAHGIHFNDTEVLRLGAAGCGIAHCPSSNMLLASGICPALALEAAGCAIGLGVDGSASNDSSNLIAELRQALLIQRLGGAEPLVSHEDVLRWATAGGAQLLGRPELGSLAVGAMADLALFDLDDLRFSGAEDPLAALILCGAHRADAVMVQGRWRVRNGELCDVDTDQLRFRHEQAAAALRRAL